jgi:hypothetical protein
MIQSMLDRFVSVATASIVLLAGDDQKNGQPAQTAAIAKASNRQLLELHTNDAASFAMFRDAKRTQKLELRREPVYRWTNPTRSMGQEGDVFVWTYRGRPEVIGSIFSHPIANNERRVCHELHSLSPVILVVDRDASEQWVPQSAGVDLKPVEGAPAPAGTAPQRLAQMRGLAREFTGRSKSVQGQAWELRLLPQPLFRYRSNDAGVIDGAVFALVSNAGTDPEIIILLEARTSETGQKWVYAAARFSDMSLWLSYKNEEIWTSIRSSENTFNHDAKHRYRFYEDREIPEFRNAGSTPDVKQ